jgi:hypothetical protein
MGGPVMGGADPNNAGGAPSGFSVAEATPPANPATEPQTEKGDAAQAVPPGAVSGGVAPTSAGDTKAISEADVQKLIAKFAKMAGLGELKSDGSHQGNVVNAAKVLAKLTELGKKDPKMQAASTDFLKEMASAGKGVYNWGLKLNGVPLNKAFMSDKAFQGVGAQNPKGTPLPAQQDSQPPADGASQPGPNTQASSDASSEAQPLNESGPAKQEQTNGEPSSPTAARGTGSGQGMSADQVREAVTPLLQKVAALDTKGDPNTISRAELGGALKSKGLNPQVKQLLTLLDQQMQASKADGMSVANAANFVASLVPSSSPADAQQTQMPQGAPNTTQPQQQQQGAAR